jgi:hypothetical protein
MHETVPRRLCFSRSTRIRDIRLGVPVNFTGESFMDVIGFSSYSCVHDGPGGSGRLRYEVEDGVAVNYSGSPQ